jgi:hypothetical protein
MLLAGIQAEFGLDSRLKHSGVTSSVVASLHLRQNFRRSAHPDIGPVQLAKFRFEMQIIITFVYFVRFMVSYPE